MNYNIALANRFVSDYKLPIPITLDESLFNYYLINTEEDYGSLTKYRNLLSLIEEYFDDNADIFLKYYYDIRENIIQAMLDNPAYQEFNKMDMNQFSIKDKCNISTNNIYNCDNNGKVFISIDLKKANFQALKYVNEDIVYSQETYEDFIGMFTKLQYIQNSKYTRQVIFGKLNPKRHIAVEKYITNEIRKYVENHFINELNLELVSFCNDELIYKFPDIIDINHIMLTTEITEKYKKEIKENFNIDVSIEVFQLNGIKLYNKHTNKLHNTFFEKHSKVYPFKKELKCVPQPLFPIIYKLYKNKQVTSSDKKIIYEGMFAEITDDFYIVK